MKAVLGGLALGLCGWLLVWACAQPLAPTGGEKDTIPPVLVFSLPAQGALNFQGQELLFVFDEWIGEKALRERLILTPQAEPPNPYRVQVRKNRLRIRFEQPLDSNKTYTLNLAGGITDLTEQNPVKVQLLSFSTGAEIDSLTVKGRVFWPLIGEAAEDALVQLVAVREDSVHYSQRRGAYVTKTDEMGLFAFSYLSAGAYRLWAFMDKNNNFKFDPQKEAHAFVKDTLHLVSDTLFQQKTWLLPMVEQDASEFVFVRGRAQGKHYILDYNKGLLRYRLYQLDTIGMPTLHSQLTKDKKGVRIYKNAAFKSAVDSLAAAVMAEDVQGNVLLDTVFVSFYQQAFSKKAVRTKKSGAKQVNKPKKTISFKPVLKVEGGTEYLNKNITVQLQFSLPIQTHVLDSIRYMREDSSRHAIPNGVLEWNHNFTVLSFALQAPEGEHFELQISAGGFVNITGDSSSVLKQRFTRANPLKYGSLSGQIDTAVPYFIMELVDTKHNPLYRTQNTDKFKIEGLKSGNYYFRLIEDYNQNGIWNSGNLLHNIPPERIYLPDTTISIRESWILENIRVHFPTKK